MFAESTQDHSHTDLSGKRIFVVEDEYYIADALRRLLEQAGAEVVGPISSLDAAHRRVDQQDFDCAVLDLNLHGENATCIADRIAAIGKPFVIATGYGSPSIPDGLKHAPRVEKPFEPAALLSLIAQMPCAGGVAGPA